MTQAQVTPWSDARLQNSYDSISKSESSVTTCNRRVTTKTRANVSNFLLRDEACPKWEISYLYSFTEDYMLLNIEVLETIIDNFNHLSFFKLILDS